MRNIKMGLLIETDLTGLRTRTLAAQGIIFPFSNTQEAKSYLFVQIFQTPLTMPPVLWCTMLIAVLA
jgi:hypothetical protein